MKSRTAIHIFGLKTAGSLLLAAFVAPLWGQQTDEFVSSRITHPPAAASVMPASVAKFSPGSNSAQPSILAKEKVIGSGYLEPMEDPSWQKMPGKNGNSPTKLPKLADPEQFKVRNAKLTGPWFKLQDETVKLPTLTEIQEKSRSTKPNSDDDSMLDSKRAESLRTGILNDSMQRAVFQRDKDYADPNLSFVASATLGQEYSPSYKPITKTWRSPNMLHRPLYFEDANLERYGNGVGFWQPAVSGFRFFSSVALLPYKAGQSSMSECEYSLGHFRPGDCNPAYKPSLEFSGRGTAFQGLVIGGILSGL